MGEKTTLILLISGFFGSLIRVIRKPMTHWKQWLIQFIVGMISAVFIGGFISHLIIKWAALTDVEGQLWATCATAFVIGTSAERIIEAITNRMEKKLNG